MIYGCADNRQLFEQIIFFSSEEEADRYCDSCKQKDPQFQLLDYDDTPTEEFPDGYTIRVTEKVDGKVSATTLNSAANKACGANKKKFTLVFMHSDVSTNLENLNLG